MSGGTTSLKNRRIALIGGAGFIGHNLALHLSRMGAEVSVIDGLEVNSLLYFTSMGHNVANRDLYLRMINERLDLLRKAEVPLLIQDARDYGALCTLIGKLNPQVIIHLAAVAHANRSNKDPYTTFDHSLRTLENALDNARDKCEHFVYFSSSMVYGDFQEDYVTEESICTPLGIYGALKYSGELIVRAYNQVFDLPYTIVRPSALYGPRCVSRRVGQIFIENALRGEKVVVQGGGSERLDFTYIEDLCHGIVQVLTHKEAINETFNLTYGESRSVEDMIDILKEEFSDLKIESAERDKLMPKRGTLRVDKARNLIGYSPKWPLEKGFREYIKWYKTNTPRVS